MRDQPLDRILLVRLDNVGDMVMLSPALRALRTAYPRAKLTLLASRAGSQVVPLLPWVDDVIVRRAPWQDVSGAYPLDPKGELAFIDELAAGRFDSAFIFTSFSQSPLPPAYACYLAGIPRRLGESREFGGALLTHAAPPLPDHVHQVSRNLHLLESAGIRLAGDHLELDIPATARVATEALLGAAGIDPGEPFILVAPGASCDSRRYPPGAFAETAFRLTERTSLRIVAAGAEADRATCDAIVAASAAGSAVSLAGMTSIPELAALIAAARLVIANNSGPLHIAEATGTPMVILYSGTDLVSQWRPRNAPAVILRRETPCTPCYAFSCRFNHECLAISPGEVVNAALGLLAQTAAPTNRPSILQEVSS